MRARLWIAALAIGFASSPAIGQAEQATPTLVTIERTVYVGDRRVEPGSLPTNVPDGIVIRAAEGRAAIALRGGGSLFLEAGTTVRLQNDNIDLLNGSAILTTTSTAPVVNCESSVRLSSSGRFRFDALPITSTGGRPCSLRVYEGMATVPLATVTSTLRAGQSMHCDRQCGDMIPTRQFSTTDLDEFDRWARRTQASRPPAPR